MTIPFCVHNLSSAFHFSLKQIAEIYAKINSPLGYSIFGRLEIGILVLMLQTANFANFLQEIRKSEKITRFSGLNDFVGYKRMLMSVSRILNSVYPNAYRTYPTPKVYI